MVDSRSEVRHRVARPYTPKSHPGRWREGRRRWTHCGARAVTVHRVRPRESSDRGWPRRRGFRDSGGDAIRWCARASRPVAVCRRSAAVWAWTPKPTLRQAPTNRAMATRSRVARCTARKSRKARLPARHRFVTCPDPDQRREPDADTESWRCQEVPVAVPAASPDESDDPSSEWVGTSSTRGGAGATDGG